MTGSSQRLYLFLPQEAAIAMRFSAETGAACRVISSMHDLCDISTHRCVAVYSTATGRFPSKHLRIHPDAAVADSRGQPVPEDLALALGGLPYQAIAMRPNSTIGAIVEALRYFHLRDERGKWTGPKRSGPSRLAQWRERRRQRQVAHFQLARVDALAE